MDERGRTNIVAGLVLIFIGGIFLVYQLFPGLRAVFDIQFSWPLIIVAVGVAMLLFGLIGGAPDLAVPATIVGGVGGLLYWQNATGNWASWAYVWTLIPGFVGLGVLIAGLAGGRPRERWLGGLNLIVVSLVLFLIFGAFLGGLDLLGPYWPALLILLGLYLLVRPGFRSTRT